MTRARENKKMDIPSYCTQNDGRCLSCSLSNYGRDCMNNKIIVEVVNWDEARESGVSTCKEVDNQVDNQ